MCTSMPWWTPWSWSVRIISRPVRSPTCARRGYLCPPKLRWRMRPSAVRSKSAPQASSSRTRSGASRACSSAMRQLFTYWPPRMVSAKCTRQLSRSSTLPSAAATPPSAITVCALPSSDLHTSPTFAPAADAAIAARSPAPPAPITSTSWSKVWYSGMSERSQVSSRRSQVAGHCRADRDRVALRLRDSDSRLDLRLHRILQSVQTPIEQSRTYRSANATEKRLVQAQRMCQRLRQLEQS